MKKILAIDDQKDNLVAIKALLKKFIPNCEVFIAQSGKEGLDIARKEQPDTILLDIIMPKMDGYEVCKKLKEGELTKHIPVIMLTAIRTDMESKIKGLDAGADAFFTKPIEPNELRSQINVMLRIKEAEDKLRAERELLDETVKKRTEELRESERRYRSLIDDVLDTSSVGIFILDSDFKVVWINSATEKYFGLKREDVIGKDKQQLIQLKIKNIFEDPANFRQKVFATYRNNTYMENFECHVLAEGDREERWLEHWSQPIKTGLYKGGRIEHYSDITERKIVREALHESEEKMRTILDSMPDVVLQLDANLKILWANKATIQLNPNAVNQFCYKALPGRSDICPGCPIVKALKTGKIEQGIVHLKSVTGVGESYWDDIGIPIKDTQGKIVSIVKLARNITEKKKAEAELAKYSEHLEELVKERTKELEEKNEKLAQFNKLFVDREFRIKELKDKIKELEGKKLSS